MVRINSALIRTFILVCTFAIGIALSSEVSAETGEGSDVFKVILTMLGAEKAISGDVVAIVTVNDHSRVRFFEVKINDLTFLQNNVSNSSFSASEKKPIEYIATFPYVTVNTGDAFKACALPLKTLKIICVEGHNSPAGRPEFVDISLDSKPDVTGVEDNPSASSKKQMAITASSDTDRDKGKEKSSDKVEKSSNKEASNKENIILKNGNNGTNKDTDLVFGIG